MFDVIRLPIVMLCLLSTACVHDQTPVTVAASETPNPTPPPKPAPECVYSKQGATTEEFQRTRAACLLRQTEAENANPNSWSWFTVFPLCMRANDWVLLPKS